MIKIFVKEYFSVVTEQNTKKLETMKEYYKEEGMKKLEEFDKKYLRKR